MESLPTTRAVRPVRRKNAIRSGGLLKPHGPESALPDETIEMIVEQLVASGAKREDIVMPGSGIEAILFVSDDFDLPTADFADYM